MAAYYLTFPANGVRSILTTDTRGDPYTAIVNPLATNPRCNTAVS